MTTLVFDNTDDFSIHTFRGFPNKKQAQVHHGHRIARFWRYTASWALVGGFARWNLADRPFIAAMNAMNICKLTVIVDSPHLDRASGHARQPPARAFECDIFDGSIVRPIE